MTKAFTAILAIVLVALSLTIPVAGQDIVPRDIPTANEPRDEENLVNIHLDDVELVDVIRMFTKISGANIIYDPGVVKVGPRTTISAEREPWQPLLASILSDHGFVLVEDTDTDVRTITPVDSPAVAARYRAAQSAVSFADDIIKDLRNGDMASAALKVTAFRAKNKRIVDSIADVPAE